MTNVRKLKIWGQRCWVLYSVLYPTQTLFILPRLAMPGHKKIACNCVRCFETGMGDQLRDIRTVKKHIALHGLHKVILPTKCIVYSVLYSILRVLYSIVGYYGKIGCNFSKPPNLLIRKMLLFECYTQHSGY